MFVHPCEFLETGPDGAILTQTLVGNSLLVSPARIGSEQDPKRVFYFDLPVRGK